MTKNTEIELKLLVSKENFKRLLALDFVAAAVRKDSMQKRKLVSSYYDTEDLAFKRNGIAYRVRSKGDGTYEATVKTTLTNSAGLSERLELNLPLKNSRPQLEGFAELGLGYELSELAPTGISKLFTVNVQRTTYILDLPGAVAELAVDHGKIVAAKDAVDGIDEIEIELLEGDRGELLKLAAQIAEQVPLFVEKRSKFVRGLALRGIEADMNTAAASWGSKPAQSEILACIAEHGERLLDVQKQLCEEQAQSIDARLLKALRRELLTLRALESLAAVEKNLLLDRAVQLAERARTVRALQELWTAIKEMADKKLELGRTSLGKKLLAMQGDALQGLQELAEQGSFTAIVYGLNSAVYAAVFAAAEQTGDEAVRAAIKKWQEEDSLAAVENICALARIGSGKAFAKALASAKKQRRLLVKQQQLEAYRELLLEICADSTSKAVFRDTGLVLGYLLAESGRA